MKYLNFLFVVLLSGFLAACSSNDKNTTTTTNNNTPNNTANNTQTQTQQNTKSSGGNIAAVSSVQPSTGKNVAPNFSWAVDGKTTSLNDLKGNVVFVNLWATWCGPCKAEMPDLSAISQELNGKNFKMLGVSVFEQQDNAVQTFIQKNPVAYQILTGNDDLVAAFSKAINKDINAIPMTLIIDKDGNIVEAIEGKRSKEDFLKLINKYLV
jgi:thiol-disulfide isomerase/thioredoxin